MFDKLKIIFLLILNVLLISLLFNKSFLVKGDDVLSDEKAEVKKKKEKKNLAGWENVVWSDIDIDGGLKQIDIDGDIVCGVNASDEIYCKDGLKTGTWETVDGALLNDISVSGGKIIGVNSSGSVFYSEDKNSASWEHIDIDIDGGLKQLDIDGDKACGVNASDEIYCTDNLKTGTWTKVPGGLKHISVSGGKIMGVNSADMIHYAKDPNSAWENIDIDGGLKQIDIYGDIVCGVNASDEIYCKDGLKTGTWKKVPTDKKMKYVAVGPNNVIYGIDINNKISTAKKY